MSKLAWLRSTAASLNGTWLAPFLLMCLSWPLHAGELRQEPAQPVAQSLFATDAGQLRCAVFPGHTDCLGIPYAAPPLGSLRFMAPAPAAKWSEVRDATRFAPSCLQAKSEYLKQQEGAEDCLYLNLYKPAAPTASAPLPVIVWLHGGGFVNGSGNAFNGAYLAQTSGAMVVTVNYRLGPFGWLALPSLAAEDGKGTAGNYGLLDSVAALQWVQRNAASFGGDPNRVTISGQSAGGEQTLALVGSPYGKGLFQHAIAMSAPAGISMPTLKASAEKRTAFLKEVGCADPASQAACLRSAKAQTLLDAAHVTWNMTKAGGLGWTPVIDGQILTDQWLNLFRSGAFNKVPVIIGHTGDEAGLFIAIYENGEHPGMTPEQADKLATELRQTKSAALWQGFMRLAVDAHFVLGEHHDRLALVAYVPTYGYRWCDPRAPESHIHALYTRIGCGHDADLAYLFQWDDFEGKQPAFDAEQQMLAVQMGRYWGNFAATGDPNGQGLPHWSRQSVDSDVVQLLEPASTGGVRASTPGAYSADHHFSFVGELFWIISHARLVGGLIVAGLVFLIVLIWRSRRRKRA